MSALREPVEVLRWLHGEVREQRPLPAAEAVLVVRALEVALAEAGGRPSLIALEEPADYILVHSVNVALLAMRLGREFGVTGEDTRVLGLAGMLHDIGTLLADPGLTTKPAELTDEERALVKRHPIDGARILMGAGLEFDLAAIVAYEHHIRMDGGGYPTFRFHRSCHFASRLVQLCDVFDALSTKRPHKDAWPLDIVLSYLSERSGFEFDPEIARALASMARQLESEGALGR